MAIFTFGLLGTLAFAVLILVAGRKFFPVLLMLALACLAGLWSMLLSLPDCDNGCSPGAGLAGLIVSVPVALVTLILVPALLIKAFLLYGRR